MQLDKYYPLVLVFVFLMVLMGAALFKYKTGSFIKIGETAKREIQRQDIEKNKENLSVESLKATSVDLDKTYSNIKRVISASENTCVKNFWHSISEMPNDSAFFYVMLEVFEHVEYFDQVRSDDGMIVSAYHSEDKNCDATLQIVLIEDEYGEMLFLEVNYFDQFIGCTCD